MAYFEIDGSKLYYEVAGEGETLLLSHAGFVDSRMWDAQWDEFAKHYRVIRYDMRGYGKSDPVEGPVSRRDDLFRLLRHLNIERASLVGSSMSGEIVLDFTLEHPEMVSALVVVSATPSGFELQGAPPPNLMEMMEAMQKGDLERASELQIRIWIDGMYRQPDQVNPDVRKQAAEMNRIPVKNGTWAKADMQPLNPLNPPAVGRLGEIHAPTLIVAGDLDHPEILRAADFMQAGIAGSKKHIISGTAHMPSMEKPEEFNRVVLDFLREAVRV
jgi:2-hydroxy-6-oxonona-2,4-dienedioate hydrolase